MKTVFVVTILLSLSTASAAWISAVMLFHQASQVIHISIDIPGHP
jgi:hypothetical protein